MSLKVGSCFSGVGAWEKAFTNLGIDHELKWFFEIDKYAPTAYCAIHDVSKDLNKGDITCVKTDELEDIDVLVYSPPCQSFSVAGKRLGIKDPRGTLFYYTLPIIAAKKPKYALMENVKGLTMKGMNELFEDMLKELEKLGYNNYWKVLNSKDYGIPQNRDRVYIVSIRKDIDDGSFAFPAPFDTGLRLKHLLEDEVDERYYINNEKTKKLLENLKDKELLPGGVNVSRKGEVFNSNTEVATCLLARDYKGLGNQSMTAVAEPIIVASRGRNPENPSDRTTGSPTEQRLEPNSEGICNTLTTVQKDNLVLEPSVLTPKRTEYGKAIRKDYESGKIQESRHNMTELQPREDGISNTLTTVQKDNLVLEPNLNESYPKRLGGLYDKEKSKHQAGSVWDKEEIAPTIDTCGGGQREPLILEENELKFIGGIGEKDWARDGKDLSRNFPQGYKVYDPEGIACSQTSNGGGIGGPTGLYNIDFKIRKLTPKECWRLMSFSDEDYEKAKLALMNEHYNGRDRTNSQMYKMAGNSVVVRTLEEIYKKLFKDLIPTNWGED